MLDSKPRLRRGLQWTLSAFFVAIGASHFANPDQFLAIMPPQLPAPEALVYISGAFEMCLGIALSIPRVSRIAAWGIIALLIAVYPANIYHAWAGGIDHPSLPRLMANPWVAYARLPFQFVFMAWAYIFTRDVPAEAPRKQIGSQP